LSGSAASALVGLAVAGPIVDATSLPLWFFLAGIVSVAVGVLSLFVSSVREIERGDPSVPQAA
jgi:hypothetical protein